VLRAISGLLRPRRRDHARDENITGYSPRRLRRLGRARPQERSLFPLMTVGENLLLAATSIATGEPCNARRGAGRALSTDRGAPPGARGSLSGGEQKTSRSRGRCVPRRAVIGLQPPRQQTRGSRVFRRASPILRRSEHDQRPRDLDGLLLPPDNDPRARGGRSAISGKRSASSSARRCTALRSR